MAHRKGTAVGEGPRTGSPPRSTSRVAHLHPIGEVVHFAPGDTLIAFGSPSEALFCFLDGEAAAWNEVSHAASGREHAKMSLLAGRWTIEMNVWPGPGAEPFRYPREELIAGDGAPMREATMGCNRLDG